MRGWKWPPWLAGGAATPDEVRNRLLGNLFAPDDVLRTGVALAAIIGGLAAWRLAAVWPLVWAAATSWVCLYRVWLAGRFTVVPAETAGRIEDWTRRFAFGAWGYAACWGVLGLAAGFCDDGLVRMAFISAAAVLVRGFVARNNASPATAFGQILLVLVPMLAGCLLSGDAFMIAFSLFVLLQLYAALRLIESASQRTLRLLNAEFIAASLYADLKHANARLARLAITDELTDLPNRRGFDQRLEAEWRRARRESLPLAVVMIDVDHFKAYNDAYGHIDGDACLRQVACALRTASGRGGDVVARYGGEEFVMVLPATDIAGAMAVAEAARAEVAGLRIPHKACALGHLTVTLGCAALVPGPDMAPLCLVRLADRALYAAKQTGRNQVQGAFGAGGAVPPETEHAADAAANTAI